MFPFWIHLNPYQIVMNDSKFKCHVTYSLSMRCPIWTTIFLNKMLVSTNCCTLMYYFQPWLKNVHRHWFFCFKISSRMRDLSRASLLPSALKSLLSYIWNSKLPTISFVKALKCFSIFLLAMSYKGIMGTPYEWV